MGDIEKYLTKVPDFLLYFGVSIALLAVFIFIYTLVTPHKEFKLIKEGKASAGISLIGSILGFVLPLASLIIHSSNILDLILWAIVALIVQIIVFFIIRLIFIRDLSTKISENNISCGILVGGLSFIAGIINAVCLIP